MNPMTTMEYVALRQLMKGPKMRGEAAISDRYYDGLVKRGLAVECEGGWRLAPEPIEGKEENAETRTAGPIRPT
jgi:hypothetical protein